MRRWAPALFASAFALLQFRLIVFVFGPRYRQSVDAAHGIVDGYPHWRIFQSRVLGPYLVAGISKLGLSYLAAHVTVSLLLLGVAGICAWRLGERIARGRGFIALVLFHLAFALLLAPPWLYIWDYADVIVFLVFFDFVLSKRSWPWLIGLFAIGLLNHEIARFIPVYLVLESLVRWRATRKLDWQPLAAGVAALVISVFVVEGLRSALLVEAVGPKLFRDAPAEMGSAMYFSLPANLKVLAASFSSFDYALPWLVPIFVVGIAVLAVGLVRRGSLALGVTMLLLEGSLLAFGVLQETRIYVVFIPLLILAAMRTFDDTHEMSSDS